MTTVYDRIRQGITTAGSAESVTLGAVVRGYTPFGDVVTLNDTVPYVIEDGENYEIGEGVLTAPNTFERTTVESVYVGRELFTVNPSRLVLSGSAQIFIAVTAKFLSDLAAAIGGVTEQELNDAIATRAPLVHTHVIADITDLQTELDGKRDTGAIPIADITGLQAELDSIPSLPIGISDVTGLQTELDSIPNLPIQISDVSGLQTALGNIPTLPIGISDVTGLQAELDTIVDLPISISDITGLQTILDTIPTNVPASFFDLTNTPAGFGLPGQVVAVNTAGDGFIFADPATGGGGAATLIGLTDTPTSYTGAAGQVLTVNQTNNGVIFAPIPTPTVGIDDISGLRAELDTIPNLPIAISDVSGLQAALGDKLESPIAISDVTGLQAELDTIVDFPIAISDVTGLQDALNGIPTLPITIANVSGLQTELNGKAAVSHTHVIADITGLQAELDTIPDLPIAISDVTNLQTELNGKLDSSAAVTTIGGLTDVPNNFGTAGQVLAVNSAGTALEYVNQTGSGGGSSTWTGLTDTPSSITADQFVRGNAAGDALEFSMVQQEDVAGLNPLLTGLQEQITALQAAAGVVDEWDGQAVNVPLAVRLESQTGGLFSAPGTRLTSRNSFLLYIACFPDFGTRGAIFGNSFDSLIEMFADGRVSMSFENDAGSDLFSLNSNIRRPSTGDRPLTHIIICGNEDRAQVYLHIRGVGSEFFDISPLSAAAPYDLSHTGEWEIGGLSNTSRILNLDMARIALWADLDTDLSDSSNILNFVNIMNGNMADVSVSDTAYPNNKVFDFYIEDGESASAFLTDRSGNGNTWTVMNGSLGDLKVVNEAPVIPFTHRGVMFAPGARLRNTNNLVGPLGQLGSVSSYMIYIALDIGPPPGIEEELWTVNTGSGAIFGLLRRANGSYRFRARIGTATTIDIVPSTVFAAGKTHFLITYSDVSSTIILDVRHEDGTFGTRSVSNSFLTTSFTPLITWEVNDNVVILNRLAMWIEPFTLPSFSDQATRDMFFDPLSYELVDPEMTQTNANFGNQQVFDYYLAGGDTEASDIATSKVNSAENQWTVTGALGIV